jgi:hypothetical protein
MTVRCPDCGDENPSTRARCGSCGGQLRISALDTLTTTRPELVILDIGAELIDIFEEFSFGSTGPDPVHAEALLAALQLLRDIPEEDVEEALDELLPAHRAHAERLLHKARETRGLHPSPPRVRAAIQAEAGSNSEGRGRVQPQLEDRGGDLTVNDVLDKHGSGRPTRHKIVGGQCKTTYQVTGRGRGSRIGYFEAVVVLGRAAPQVWRALLPYHLSGAGGGFVVHASGEAVVYAPGVSRQPQAEAVSNEAWAVLQLDLHETWRLLRDRAQATRPPKAPPKRQPAQPLASALLVLRKGGEVTDFALLHGMERPALGRSSSEADVPVRDPKDVEAVGISRKLLQLECEGSVPLLRRLGKSGVLVGNAPVGTQEEIVLREDGSLSFARAGADPLRWRYHVLAALPGLSPAVRWREPTHPDAPGRLWHLCARHGGLVGPPAGLLDLGGWTLRQNPLQLRRERGGWCLAAPPDGPPVSVDDQPLDERGQGLRHGSVVRLPDDAEITFYEARGQRGGPWRLLQLLHDELEAYRPRLIHLVAE